jgi:hypothetical protein
MQKNKNKKERGFKLKKNCASLKRFPIPDISRNTVGTNRWPANRESSFSITSFCQYIAWLVLLPVPIYCLTFVLVLNSVITTGRP